jgi:ATP-dependent Clp protease ATP-binding subunit ClpC
LEVRHQENLFNSACLETILFLPFILFTEPGVGKTAVAEAIAQVLASSAMEEGEQKKPRFSIKNPFKKNNDNDSESSEQREVDYILPKCPTSLAGARLISIDLASLVAGTANRGDFEKKVQNLIKEASTSNVILFIDEIHNLIGTGGGGDGTMNAANLLKPALARGDLRILGATTTPEYRRYIEKDGALERRFQPLEIKEPSVDETIDILATIMPRYEEYHGVEYTSNALVAAAKLSDRYVTDRFLPDKAIDLLDEAGSMIKMREEEENSFVTEDTVCEVISEISGIPIGRLDTGEKARLKNLDDEIGKRIKGQDQAVSAVSKAIRRSRSGMRDPKRPVSSFLFVGPTGVGKTELCKALAETYFGKEKDMIRIDMSEYMDRFSVSRLIGSPPGYVGYEEGGQLTEAVRRSPHSVVLFDELEKVSYVIHKVQLTRSARFSFYFQAHEDVLNILLQIMDEGKLTDGKGRTVNFKNTIIAMTSNIGSRSILEKSKESSRDDLASETSEIVKQELEQTMKPELLNRIDEIIVFKPLSFDIVKEIALNIFDIIAKRAANDQGIRMYISDNIAEIVTREGYVAEFGARPIRRAAKRYLEDTMAEAIIQDFVKDGDEVSIDLVAGPKNSVRITNLTANGVGNKSMIIAVEGDSGIGSTANLKWQRLYGPAPSLDDDGDDDMPREPDGFQ